MLVVDALTSRHSPAAQPLDRSILRIVEEMRRDPSDTTQTACIAERLGISPYVFIRAFSSFTGLSPQRFRAALRMSRAKELLIETSRSVTEISLDVGYSSLGTFVRTFTALMGVSPGQLRRLAKHGLSDAPFYIPRRDQGNTWPREGTISGHVSGLTETTAIVVAGLFERRLPAGFPLYGQFIDPRDARFCLRKAPKHRQACLLIAAFGALSWTEAWKGRYPAMRVARVELSPDKVGAQEVALRPVLPTDPPFLTPLPLLTML